MKTGKRGIAIITAAALAIMWLLPSWRTQAAEAVPGIPAEAVPGIPSGADNTTGMLLGAVAAGAMQAEGTELKVYGGGSGAAWTRRNRSCQHPV